MAAADEGARGIRNASFEVARLLPQTSLLLTSVLVALLLAGVLLNVAFMVASGIVVGSVPATLARGLSSPDGHRLVSALIVAGASFLVTQSFAPLKEAIAVKLGRRVDGWMRRLVMTATLKPWGISHLEDPEMLDRISLAQGVGLSHVTPGDAVFGLSENAASYLQMIAGGVVVAFFNPVLAVALVASNLFARSRLLRETGARVQVVTGQSDRLRRANYFRDLALTPAAAKETRIFGMGAWILDRFRSDARGVIERMWTERKRTGIAPLVWFAPGGLAILASFYLLGRAATHSTISLSELAVVAQAVLVAGTWFVTDNDLLIQYGGAAIAPARRVAEDLNEMSTWDDSAAVDPQAPIAFEHVAFSYPGRPDAVFDDLDLTIEPGRSFAIVGRNGSGKTTLVKLLCRLYDPTSGAVKVGATDLRAVAPAAWRKNVAAIFQDFVHYELSARANVGFGAVDSIDDLASLEDAARRAGALDVIAGAPEGWDSVLSRGYRGGIDLSGGQWQRVALARVLMAVDAGAGLLILDEPTANLDVRAEAEVFDAILKETRGKTTILVSHRFSTVRKVDRICVLDEGRVIELGSHDELMVLGGHYASMFRLQASPFTDGSADD